MNTKPVVHLSRDDWELLFAPTKTPIVNASMTFWEAPDSIITSEEPINQMTNTRWYTPYQVNDDALIVVYNTYDFDLLASDDETVLNRHPYHNYSIAAITEEAQDWANGRCEEIIVMEINGMLEPFTVKPEDCQDE